MWRWSEGLASPAPVVVVLAFLLGTASCSLPSQDADMRGSPMPEGVAAPELALTDTEGAPLQLREEARDGVTLVFFGYTHCPDICPVHMATLGAAYGELEPEVRDRVQVLFVSTDPERDTPERLRSWLDAYHRDFVGARAPMEEINRALGELMLPGVAVMPSEHEGGEPLIGHPSAVVAFGPDGLARFRYPFGMRRADWLHDLPRLVDEL